MVTFGFLATIIFAILAILVAWHFEPCIRELKQVMKRGPTEPGNFEPNVRVILCLRGADPFLDRCLHGLASQDYPNYKVLIVVDSAGDESVPLVEKLLHERGNERVEMQIRDRILPNCSRRASSLFSGLHHVPDDVDVVVMCDADAVPHATWIRELVAPLQDPLTVATSGNRWYAPIVMTVGGMCRYFWNALAFRAMYRYRIPWCGSLAMRRDLFRDPEFQHCLQHAFSEDTALAGFLANKELHATPIVSLVMLNEEKIGLKSFWGFLIRQMLAARLNHPHWPTILTEALVIFLVMWILLPLAILQGPVSLGWWIFGGFIYDTTVMFTILRFELLLRRHVRESRQQIATPFNLIRIVMAPMCLLITGFIYPIAVLITVFTRLHEWRGIVYRIESKGVTTLYEREEFQSRPKDLYESV